MLGKSRDGGDVGVRCGLCLDGRGRDEVERSEVLKAAKRLDGADQHDWIATTAPKALFDMSHVSRPMQLQMYQTPASYISFQKPSATENPNSTCNAVSKTQAGQSPSAISR